MLCLSSGDLKVGGGLSWSLVIAKCISHESSMFPSGSWWESHGDGCSLFNSHSSPSVALSGNKGIIQTLSCHARATGQPVRLPRASLCRYVTGPFYPTVMLCQGCQSLSKTCYLWLASKALIGSVFKSLRFLSFFLFSVSIAHRALPCSENPAPD